MTPPLSPWGFRHCLLLPICSHPGDGVPQVPVWSCGQEAGLHATVLPLPEVEFCPRRAQGPAAWPFCFLAWGDQASRLLPPAWPTCVLLAHPSLLPCLWRPGPCAAPRSALGTEQLAGHFVGAGQGGASHQAPAAVGQFHP